MESTIHSEGRLSRSGRRMSEEALATVASMLLTPTKAHVREARPETIARMTSLRMNPGGDLMRFWRSAGELEFGRGVV